MSGVSHAIDRLDVTFDDETASSEPDRSRHA